MKANPGGQISVNEIIGRDSLIRNLWSILEQQSVIMTAERRIGKTHVILKMQAEPPPNCFPVFQDLEPIHSAGEFALSVYKRIQDFLGRWKKIANKAQAFWQAIGGTSIGGVLQLPESKEKHWKPLLTHAVEDLVREQDPNRLVFLWDEVPLMLDNIRKREGESTAMEILDVLRWLRQSMPGFRMVLTGSIGLHHVLTCLKDKDYINEPFNDMYSLEVPPLEPDMAQELARQLVQGEGLACSNVEQAAALIALEGDNFPFYIHHIVLRLKLSGRAAEPDQIQATVRQQMVDANDPWELKHYRSRIRPYYGQDEKLILVVLDTLADSGKPLAVKNLLRMVKSQIQFDDRDRLLQLLTLLERDHYLQRTASGQYQFRFPMIQRWWKLERGL